MRDRWIPGVAVLAAGAVAALVVGGLRDGDDQPAGPAQPELGFDARVPGEGAFAVPTDDVVAVRRATGEPLLPIGVAAFARDEGDVLQGPVVLATVLDGDVLGGAAELVGDDAPAAPGVGRPWAGRRAGRGTALVVWGKGVTRDELVAASQEIGVTRQGTIRDAPIAGDMRLVGRLGAAWSAPPRGVEVAATGGDTATVHLATREEAVALLALMAPDIGAQAVEAGDGVAWRGVVAPDVDALVLPGEPGAALLARGALPARAPALLAQLQRVDGDGLRRRSAEAASQRVGRERVALEARHSPAIWVADRADGVTVLVDTDEVRLAGDGPVQVGARRLLCLIDVQFDGFASDRVASCVEPGRDLAVASGVVGGREVVWGVVTGDVTRIDVRLPSGAARRPVVRETALAEPAGWFLLRVPAEERRAPTAARRTMRVTVLDGGGAVLEVARPDAEGVFRPAAS